MRLSHVRPAVAAPALALSAVDGLNVLVAVISPNLSIKAIVDGVEWR